MLVFSTERRILEPNRWDGTWTINSVSVRVYDIIHATPSHPRFGVLDKEKEKSTWDAIR